MKNKSLGEKNTKSMSNINKPTQKGDEKMQNREVTLQVMINIRKRAHKNLYHHLIETGKIF